MRSKVMGELSLGSGSALPAPPSGTRSTRAGAESCADLWSGGAP